MPATYYDVVLLLIPTLLFGVGGSLTFAGLQTSTALFAGGVLAVGVLLHALFARAPVKEKKDQAVETLRRSP